MAAQIERPQYFHFKNGSKNQLPFSQSEYDARLGGLRAIMSERNLDAVLLTSMHNVAYYSGFLYCSFGRPYACVVTHDRAVTISANIDGGQPGRQSAHENLTYTDWQRDNYWRAVKSVFGGSRSIGFEGDHLTLIQRDKLAEFLGVIQTADIAPATMSQRMRKSNAELELIREGARIADVGGEAIKSAISQNTREIDIAMAGRNAMEIEIARSHPNSEIRDNWVWFQSGINTDGAHNPVTTRKLQRGDILSLNAFPMISGYYTALELTLFLGEPDETSLKIWQANVEAHELGISHIRPGKTCAQICQHINAFFEEKNLLQYRTFGYGHSFGLLSHYYGREAGLELREDIDTVLEPGMVISMEPMLTIPQGQSGAGGYREHDILIITKEGAQNITRFPYGPEHNIIEG
ncbi:MAG: aminopeptidase P family protein [Rhizobiaceae bacterium]|nr:aminopeptidase P family protein [Rhizobiaceae bacterium]